MPRPVLTRPEGGARPTVGVGGVYIDPLAEKFDRDQRWFHFLSDRPAHSRRSWRGWRRMPGASWVHLLTPVGPDALRQPRTEVMVVAPPGPVLWTDDRSGIVRAIRR